MSGALGRLDLLPPENLETGSRLLLVTQDALNSVLQKGIRPPSAPVSCTGELPADLTQLNDAQLGNLLNEFSQLCSWTDFEVALANAELSASKANLEFIKSRVRISLRADDSTRKMTVQDKNDLVNTNPLVLQAMSRYLYWETAYDCLKSIRDRYQLGWETVSRRITQRGQEVERLRRDGTVQSVPFSPPRTFVRPTGR